MKEEIEEVVVGRVDEIFKKNYKMMQEQAEEWKNKKIKTMRNQN